MAQTTAPVVTRHPMDEALDLYSEGAESSGDPTLIEDAQRQHLIRGHRNFDAIVKILRTHDLPVRPHRKSAHVDKPVLTGSMPVIDRKRGAVDPETVAKRLAALMADEINLPRGQWIYRILTLASEYARD